MEEDPKDAGAWCPSPAELALLKDSAWDEPSPLPDRWVEAVCRQAAEALRAVMNTNCDVARLAQPPASFKRAYELHFETRDGRGSISMSLDDLAARAVADTAARTLGGAVGCGHLTDTEFGVIDFVVTNTLAMLGSDGMAEGWRIGHFGSAGGEGTAEEPKAAPTDPGPSSLSLTVAASLVLGFNRGTVLAEVVLPEPPRHAPPAGAEEDPTPGASIGLELRYGPLELEPGLDQPLEIGDVILMGVTDLTGPGRPLRVVSDTGWEIAPAIGTEQTPLRLSVEVGPWCFAAPTSLPTASSPARRQFDVRLGCCQVRRDDLPRFKAGDVIDFSCDGESTIALLDRCQVAWTGELVKIDGDMGVRLLASHDNTPVADGQSDATGSTEPEVSP